MKRVLVVLGGGIRGLGPAHLLRLLDEEISGDLVGRFDLLVGTSTGGIIALGLAAGIPPWRLESLYGDRGPHIFRRSTWGKLIRLWGASGPKYKPKGLRVELERVMGRTLLGQLEHPAMVTAYDSLQGRPIFLKSWDRDDAHVPVWEAAMGTSAAPTYFPAHHGGGYRMLDGGVHANHPGMCALIEALKLWPDEAYQLVVLPTGATGWSKDDTRGWGMLRWAPEIVPLFTDSAPDLVRHQLEELASWAPSRLSVLEVPMAPIPVGMDDASPGALQKILEASEEATRTTEWAQLIKLLR